MRRSAATRTHQASLAHAQGDGGYVALRAEERLQSGNVDDPLRCRRNLDDVGASRNSAGMQRSQLVDSRGLAVVV